MIKFRLSRSVCTSAVKSTATDVNAIDGHKLGPLHPVCALLCISSRILVSDIHFRESFSARQACPSPPYTHRGGEGLRRYDSTPGLGRGTELLVFSIGRSISGPIAELREVTDRINKGDLNTSPDMNRRDEIGQLAGAIGRLQKTLQGGGKMKAAA